MLGLLPDNEYEKGNDNLLGSLLGDYCKDSSNALLLSVSLLPSDTSIKHIEKLAIVYAKE